MSYATLLSPRVNLIDTVAEAILAGQPEHEFSDTIVVFPGKRPAHFLRKKLAERLGTSYIPPKIFSIDVFVDFLYRELLHNTDVDISPLDAAAVLYTLHTELPGTERISTDHFTTLDSFYPLGQKLLTELEELHIASVSVQKLDESLAAVSLSSAKVLVSLYRQFYTELSSRGLTTRAMKYRWTAEHIKEINFSQYKHIILAGFYAFTPSETDIVRHLLAKDSVSLFFQDGVGIQSQLQKIGLELTVEREEETVDHHFYQSPDSHGELFALNSVLSTQLPKMAESNEDSVIVLPSSENLFPLFHQTLSAYDRTSYNIALGYPLTRTPVYGFLAALMDVLVSTRNGEIFVPDYIKFILHPYTKNIMRGTRSDITRILIHTVEEFCTKKRTKVYVSLEELEQSPEIMDLVEKRGTREEIPISGEEMLEHLKFIHDETIRKFLLVTSIGDLGAACVDVLQFIYEHSTAHRHPFFRPFVETLLEHLQKLPHSMLAAERFEKFEHLYGFLKNYIAEAEVPFSGTPLQGLQVLGFLETRGLQFKNVYVVDVNDDVLPGGVQQDVLMPLKIRQQLGLSTYKDQEQIKAYIFDVLRRGAENVHYFYVENETKTKSRFVEQLIWQQQLKEHSLTAGSVNRMRYAIDLRMKRPADVEKTATAIETANDLTFSATMLTTYLTCQLQFYYKYILHLYEKDEISGDVEHTDIGSIVHEVLEVYFRPFREKTLSASDLNIPMLRQIIDDVVSRYYGHDLLGEQLFTKRQIAKHLEQYIAGVQSTIVAEHRVEIQSLETELKCTVQNKTFGGRVDRIEKRDGEIHILDYKTGSNEKNVTINLKRLQFDDRSTWKKAIGSVQLPLYAMLYSHMTGSEITEIVPTIVFLGKRTLDDKTEFRIFESRDDAEQWYPTLEGIILKLVDEILDPSLPFVPTDDIESDCPSCPFTYICGTQWAEKYSVS